MRPPTEKHGHRRGDDGVLLAKRPKGRRGGRAAPSGHVEQVHHRPLALVQHARCAQALDNIVHNTLKQGGAAAVAVNDHNVHS